MTNMTNMYAPGGRTKMDETNWLPHCNPQNKEMRDEDPVCAVKPELSIPYKKYIS